MTIDDVKKKLNNFYESRCDISSSKLPLDEFCKVCGMRTSFWGNYLKGKYLDKIRQIW